MKNLLNGMLISFCCLLFGSCNIMEEAQETFENKQLYVRLTVVDFTKPTDKNDFFKKEEKKEHFFTFVVDGNMNDQLRWLDLDPENNTNADIIDARIIESTEFDNINLENDKNLKNLKNSIVQSENLNDLISELNKECKKPNHLMMVSKIRENSNDTELVMILLLTKYLRKSLKDSIPFYFNNSKKFKPSKYEKCEIRHSSKATGREKNVFFKAHMQCFKTKERGTFEAIAGESTLTTQFYFRFYSKPVAFLHDVGELEQDRDNQTKIKESLKSVNINTKFTPREAHKLNR